MLKISKNRGLGRFHEPKLTRVSVRKIVASGTEYGFHIQFHIDSKCSEEVRQVPDSGIREHATDVHVPKVPVHPLQSSNGVFRRRVGWWTGPLLPTPSSAAYHCRQVRAVLRRSAVLQRTVFCWSDLSWSCRMHPTWC